MSNPKKKRWDKNLTKKATPKKGFKWAESTSGRIPEPAVVPVSSKKKKPARLKPMRTVSSGTFGSGAPRKTEKNKARSL